MSLLTRLGRMEGTNKQVMIFASREESQDTAEEVSYQTLKHRIHQRIVDEMTPEEAASNIQKAIEEYQAK